MVFDPGKADVHIALDADTSKVVKLSIEKETIETVRGYKPGLTIPLAAGGQGLMETELRQELKA